MYESIINGIVLILLSVVVIFFSTLFEETYTDKLVHLYYFPWWKLSLVLLVVCASTWSIPVAVILSLMLVLYIGDMNILTNPLITIQNRG